MYSRVPKTLFALAVILNLVFSIDWVNAQIVKEGLVSYWPLDEAYIKGKRVVDFQGDNDGETNADPEAVEGMIGEALKFDDKNDCIVVPDSASLDVNSKITVEAWIKPATFISQYPGIVCKWDWGSGNRSYALYLQNSQNPWFMISDNGAYIGGNYECISPMPLSTDKWYHLAGVYDGSKLMLYVDGIKVCEKDLKAEIFSGTAELSIGASMNGGAVATDEIFNGIIDEVRIYNNSLTEAEVKQNYESRELATVEPAGKLSSTWGKIKTLWIMKIRS